MDINLTLCLTTHQTFNIDTVYNHALINTHLSMIIIYSIEVDCHQVRGELKAETVEFTASRF